MAKIGDTVRFLNDVGGGIIVRIEGRTAYVRDPDDGFETPMPLTECIVVPSAAAKEAPAEPAKPAGKVAVASPAAVVGASRPAVASNRPLTVALLFEPQDIRRLSQTPFDLYLVNDSGFNILYSVACRDTDSADWTLIGAGEAMPDMQVHLGVVDQLSLNSLAHISVQILANKPDCPYELQPPVNFRTRFDLTRLAKLHCFTSTDYSAVPVLTLPVTAPQTDLSPLIAKGGKDARLPSRQPHGKSMKQRPGLPEVVDLHIHELLDTTAGLTSADMLACQLREFERHMEQAARHPGTKIVFIHGKGEGVLRAALLDRLRRRWPRCEAQDASFREYGFGATQITIH